HGDPAFARNDAQDQAKLVLGFHLQHRRHPDSSPRIAEPHYRGGGDGAVLAFSDR
ncbi:MAG: hypothetical protein HW411_1461, partial [Gammaproteobacteria bacterium]|nr:hypothetical protein [Gammaproteobacteria bacterium]